jgi:hypothetical protein
LDKGIRPKFDEMVNVYQTFSLKTPLKVSNIAGINVFLATKISK